MRRPISLLEVREIIGERLAKTNASSTIVVRYVSGKRGVTGWHWVIRVWPVPMKIPSLRIGHARHLVNAERIAEEFRRLDAKALRETHSVTGERRAA